MQRHTDKHTINLPLFLGVCIVTLSAEFTHPMAELPVW